MIEYLRQPWPWYVAGAFIGLTVPALLLLGNKPFGISSNLRHICAALVPGKVEFFKYDWKAEKWNLFFAAGIMIGAFLATAFLSNSSPEVLSPQLTNDLKNDGVTDFSGMLPRELFSFRSLLTVKGFVLIVGGGFLVGFGTRFAGGCTSGHAIMGLSSLQLPSLVSTCCFMAGGLIMANFILPHLLRL